MPENYQLSDRELEILRLVATGASNKVIANELVISVNTVKVHLRNIYGKLDVSSRTEATIFAVQSGLVPSPLIDQPDEAGSNFEGSIDDIFEENNTLLLGLKRSNLIFLIFFAALVVVIFAGFVGINWWQQRNQSPEITLTVEMLEQDRWEKRTETINPKSNFASAVVDGDIYMFGGETGKGMTADVDLYRVEADTWEHISDMPQAGADFQAVTIGGKIYVPGGRLENGDLSQQLLIYDPEENIWEDAQSLPAPVSGYSLAALEGKLYLFGGWSGKDYLNLVWKYDPSLNMWESLEPMPTARGFAGAGVSGGEIHVVGGYDGEKILNIHEVYSPEQDKAGSNPWATLAPLPEPRYRSRIVSVAEIIHLIGGTSGQEINQYSYKYYSQNDAWERFLIPLKESWVDFGSEIVGENIYIFGGQVGGQKIDQHYSYRAVYSIMVPILP